MATKQNTQIRHAKMRALERFGFELNNHDYNYLCNEIKNGNSKILHKQSNRVTIHSIFWKSVEMTVVYDKLRNTIVSFLPNSERFEDVFEY